MSIINANKRIIRNKIRGSSAKLLFINGIGAGLDHSIGLFHSPLANHFTILSYDTRRLGSSKMPKMSYAMADLADDTAALSEQIADYRFETTPHGHGSWFFDPSVWDMTLDFLQC